MKYVIYHANCPDGFGSAYAAWKRLGDTAEYIPCTHGDPFPAKIKKGDMVWICDFSFPRNVLIEKQKNIDLFVLDHHKTAEADLEGLPFAYFNMNKSGAVLAWEHFHPKTDVPMLLQHVQDRDIWKWELDRSDEICTALNTYPYDFEVWDSLDLDTLYAEGSSMVRLEDALVQDVIEGVYPITLRGKKGLAFCCSLPALISKAGNKLCSENPDIDFAAAWHITKTDEGMVQKWSLRSVGDNDCSTIAKSYGGGGHKNACGFAITNVKDFIIT